MYIFLTPLLLLQPVFAQIERKEFVVKRRGGTEIFDETVSSNPRSFDYDFDGDLRHAADRNDLYDEFVGQLPDFNLYKLGKDRGTTMVPVVTRQWDTWFTPVPSRDDFALAATTPSSRLQEKTSEPLTKIEEKPSFAESPPPLLVQNRKISKETEFTTSTGTSTIIPTTIETTTPAPTATSLQPSPSTVKKFTGHSKKSTIRPSTVETTTSEASTEQPSPTTVKKFTAHSKKSTIRPSTVETTTSEASTEQPSPTTVKKFTAHSKKSTIRPTTLETTTPEASTEKLSPTTVKKFTIKWTETSHLRRTTRPTTVAPVSTTEPPTTSALPTSSSTFSVEPLQKERPIWRPTRPPQPKPVFTFATIMGVRRQKLTTTVSPRPGGIWRRGRIIFEDDTTTTSSPSTTTARATATAPNKSTKSYNREQASEEHLSIDQRVESAATATTTSEDFTRSPQLQRRPSRLLQRLELEKGHQDAPASTQQTVAPKPVVIQQGSERYKGPTFNCRILNPFEDGVATANHDPSCPMAMPGLSKDGSCRCFYTGIGGFQNSTLVCLLSASFLSSLFTIFSNLLTAIILIKSRSHGSISNLFIISLSIADMFVGVTMLLLLAYILLISSSTWSFALPWICDAWQVTDFFLSTVSLYSICAIALDRILNLEKPLHRFKRSRRLAVRLIFCVWFVPLLIWVPFYFTLTTHTRNAVASHGEKVICATGYSDPMLIFVVSLFVFYIPSVLLIAMFARISMVVHKHFSFLRKHSNNPRSPLLIRKVSSIQTLTLKKESSQTSDCGGGLRVRPTHHLTISSEEHRPLCERSYKSYGELEEETSGKDKVVRECKKSSLQLSVISRTNSMKFSIVGFPAQLKVLLQKDSVSRQIRAARAVSLILSCFLLCWLPFLILWPIKLYCRSCISDWVYAVAVFLNYMCSALNPLLYALSSPRVRVLIISKCRMLGCSSCKQSSTLNL